jgi:hypothetical protein
MTPRYPGAIWRPTRQKADGSFEGGLNNGPNTVSTHGAITTGSGEGIAQWNENEYNHCHGFVEHYGKAFQYVDFNYYVAGALDGNYRGVVTWETWDGLVVSTATYDKVNSGADQQPSGLWTDEECERLADIAAWDENVLDIPARYITSTRDRGHGVHGNGISNRSTLVGLSVWKGPDRWSTDMSKPCPGDKRIRQYLGPNYDGGAGSILERARAIAAGVRAGLCDYLPQGDVNLKTALARNVGNGPVDQGFTATDWLELFTAALTS